MWCSRIWYDMALSFISISRNQVPFLEIMTDRRYGPTNQPTIQPTYNGANHPTNWQTNMRVYGEVALPTIGTWHTHMHTHKHTLLTWLTSLLFRYPFLEQNLKYKDFNAFVQVNPLTQIIYKPVLQLFVGLRHKAKVAAKQMLTSKVCRFSKTKLWIFNNCRINHSNV